MQRFRQDDARASTFWWLPKKWGFNARCLISSDQQLSWLSGDEEDEKV